MLHGGRRERKEALRVCVRVRVRVCVYVMRPSQVNETQNDTTLISNTPSKEDVSAGARLAEGAARGADGAIGGWDYHGSRARRCARRAALGILGAPLKVLYTIIHDDVYHSYEGNRSFYLLPFIPARSGPY